MYIYDVGDCDIIAVHLDSECLILSRTSLVQSGPKGIVTVFKKLLQHMGSLYMRSRNPFLFHIPCPQILPPKCW
jgi:hypothetical protein